MKRAIRVWLVGLAMYLVAVFHRSSLAVAGLVAAHRFDINAAQLSTFTVLQLLVYAGMQVPVGVMLDRFGPRRVMVTGTIVMALAQAGFAFASSYPAALVARTFVGMGDAMTFVCLVRVISSWFRPSQIPVVTQITGPVGQVGAILAAIPMTWALAHLGWTRAYLVAAAIGVVLAVVGLLFLHDAPHAKVVTGAQLSPAKVRADVADAWSHPGTRLGFWSHFTTQFSSTALGLLWGYPYFVKGEHTSDSFAGLLLTLMVVAVVLAGPPLGWAVSRHPYQRSTIVLSVVLAIVLVWTVVLLWPGEAPRPLLVVLVVVAGLGGPTSMIGFDLVRTSNPVERLGTASGIVNQGGFLASLLLVLAIGLVLDAVTPGSSSHYSAQAYRIAMCSQYVLWAVGLSQIWRFRGLARTRHASELGQV